MSIEKELEHPELLALVQELRAELAALRTENAALRTENAALCAENAELKKRIEQLENSSKPKRQPDESYSLQAEEKRERDREAPGSGRKKKRKRQQSPRRGRITTQEKIDKGDRVELVIPDGFKIGRCHPLRKRPVWRIENGRAVRVVYDIYRGPGGEVPQIEGVLPRSEFGVEIHIAVAFLTFITGLSMDKVCGLMKFFWKLELSKSQADALLNQLSRQWESEFESLCSLLAVSAVVHADETGWSINSVWAFLSEKVRVLVFGCRKDGDTLASILRKDEFAGILVSDDAAVYRGFSTAQKCWAHLLRKAIRLTLLEPDNQRYREFLDGLLQVYRTAKRDAADGRLSETGRLHRIDLLTDMMCDLCGDRFADETEPESDNEKDFFNLVHELVRLMGEQELFTFVLHPAATGTNNEAERSLRGAALDRRTGRTSKTPSGARRRTILVSVMESLRLHLDDFTLSSVQTEVVSWITRGESLFARLLRSSGLAPPETSILNQLVPPN